MAEGGTAYRYVDGKGRLHLVDSLDKVPHAYRDRVEKLEGRLAVVPRREEPIPLSVAPPRDGAGSELAEAAARLARRPEVLVVGALVVFLLVFGRHGRLQRAMQGVAGRLMLYGAVVVVVFGLAYAAFSEYTRWQAGHVATRRDATPGHPQVPQEDQLEALKAYRRRTQR